MQCIELDRQQYKYKYGTEPNVRPPGAANPTGNTIYVFVGRVKKLREQHPLRAEISLLKMSTWVGQHLRL